MHATSLCLKLNMILQLDCDSASDQQRTTTLGLHVAVADKHSK